MILQDTDRSVSQIKNYFVLKNTIVYSCYSVVYNRSFSEQVAPYPKTDPLRVESTFV